jgi:hypothetical protein
MPFPYLSLAFPILSPYSPHTLLILSPYSPHTLPILSSYSPHTLPILSPYSPHTLPILSSYSPHTLLIRNSYTPHTKLIHSSYETHTLLIHSSYSLRNGGQGGQGGQWGQWGRPGRYKGGKRRCSNVIFADPLQQVNCGPRFFACNILHILCIQYDTLRYPFRQILHKIVKTGRFWQPGAIPATDIFMDKITNLFLYRNCKNPD